MLLAALKKVDKFYGKHSVLEDASLELRSLSRIALIGRNGAGKSTILNLLSQKQPPDSGEVYKREGIWIAKLEQDHHFEGATSILEVADQAFSELDVFEKTLQRLEKEGLDDLERYEKWERLHETFERRGGYERRSRRDAILFAFGFRGRESQKVTGLSGGEKTRLGLAQLLMKQPDVLLLDEPTNHLDIDMRAWLEDYLGRYPGALLMVSHDRELLDRSCTETAEIKGGRLRSYGGTPSQYFAYWQQQNEIEAATRKNEAKELDRLETMTQRMKLWAGNNAKLARRAKAMETRKDRFEKGMLAEAEKEERRLRFRFESDASGDIVVQMRDMAKSFGQRCLFEDVSFTLRQGERIALIGPNGAGKSSFLKVLLGDLASDNPKANVQYGARVRIGYYDQALKTVNPEQTLMQEMIRLLGDREAHNQLGRFMFPYEAQYKLIKDLSGGERARLALLKLTLGRYNFLVLDEPTNHLDTEMISALEQALRLYQGTLLVVSHDRRFIQSVSDFIWELKDGELLRYPGDWDYYMFKRKQVSKETIAKESKPKTPPNHEKKGPSAWQLRRDLETLEQSIEHLEKALKALTVQLADTSQLTNEEIAQLGQKHTELEADLEENLASWEEKTQLLEAKT